MRLDLAIRGEFYLHPAAALYGYSDSYYPVAGAVSRTVEDYPAQLNPKEFIFDVTPLP
jgi:hypothetical protein